MKVVRFHEYGGPDVLKVEDVPEPVPGPGEVRIRTEVIGVGIPDVLVRTNNDAKDCPLPMIPGNEMVGTIDAVGSDVSRFQIGDRVFLPSREMPQRGGCYVEARVAPESAPFSVPDGVSAGQMVALPNFQVARFLLDYAVPVRPGQTVLIHAAAGGVGSALVQLAKLEGLTVIGIAGGAAKAGFVSELGADAVIDRHVEDVQARVHELTDGRGVDRIYDSVAGPEFTRNFGMLADMGTVVMFGFIAGKPDTDLYMPMAGDFTRNLGMQTFSIHYFDDKPDIRRGTMEKIIEDFTQGKISPRIHGQMKLNDAADAHRLLESGGVIGKLILVP